MTKRKSNLDQIDNIVKKEIKEADFLKQVIEKGNDENNIKLKKKLFDLGCRKTNFAKIISVAKEELTNIAKEEHHITKDFISLDK